MTAKELGLGLIVLRTVRGWSQAELGKAARVPASAISEYERALRPPSDQTLKRLLGALGYGAAGLQEAVTAVRTLRARAQEPGKSS